MNTEIVNADVEIELADLGDAMLETTQSPGVTVWDNLYGMGPWHHE